MLYFVIVFFLVSSIGCSVYMAAKQPEKKDVSVLNRGTPRNFVVAELGSPAHTTVDDEGKKCDVFLFVQGYSSGVKAGRVFLHGAADVLTLGL